MFSCNFEIKIERSIVQLNQTMVNILSIRRLGRPQYWTPVGMLFLQRLIIKKLGVSPANLFKSTKVLMATPQGRRLGYHTPEQVSNQEPPDSRPCVLYCSSPFLRFYEKISNH